MFLFIRWSDIIDKHFALSGGSPGKYWANILDNFSPHYIFLLVTWTWEEKITDK